MSTSTLTSSRRDAMRPKNLGAPSDSCLEALTELFELLEDYGPVWYTEQHHERALAALRDCGVLD